MGLETDAADVTPSGAWHPELAAVHPRLFFDAADIPLLQLRIGATSGVYAGLWSTLQARCAATPPPVATDGTYGLAGQHERATICEACALEALLTGNALAAEKAAGLMAASFPDPSYINDGLVQAEKWDLYEAEALVSFCSAWDFLAGLPPSILSGASRDAARSGLEQRIDTFRAMIHEGATYLLLAVSSNNHLMKVFGALGLCAMSLNDRPTSGPDLAEAYAGLYYLLTEFQSVPEGGYAEGWNYLVYGSQSFLQLIAAHHRFANGSPQPYTDPGLLTAGSPHEGKEELYDDLAVNPTLKAVFTMAVRSALPDGLTVNTDDANPSALPGGVLAWLFDDPRFLWNWRMPAVGLSSSRLESLTLAVHDDAVPSAAPEWQLDGSFPEAGFALFRNDLAPEAILLVLQGEHGTVSSHGQGHEHPDPGSFLLAAYGEHLVLDPGYINWDHHELVMYGKDHNLVAVDGQGPPTGIAGLVTNNAFLSPLDQAQPWASHVTVTTDYAGADFARRVVRIKGLYFVVEDVVSSSQGSATPHEYTWQLNGNGGGDTPDGSFTLLPHGGRWDRPAASLLVAAASADGEPSVSSRLEEHALAWGAWASHEMLEVAVIASAPVGFLSVVFPVASGGDEPVITLLEQGQGTAAWWVERGEESEVVVSNQTGAPVVIECPVAGVEAPPGLSVVAVGPEAAPAVLALDGSSPDVWRP
jgi:hypothetical protein